MAPAAGRAPDGPTRRPSFLLLSPNAFQIHIWKIAKKNLKKKPAGQSPRPRQSQIPEMVFAPKSDDTRGTVVLKHLDGETHMQIANELRMDPHTVAKIVDDFWLTGTHRREVVPARVRRSDAMMDDADQLWLVRLVLSHPTLYGYQYVEVYNRWHVGAHISLGILRRQFKVRRPVIAFACACLLSARASQHFPASRRCPSPGPN